VVTTPRAEAGGFSGQLCGNPLAHVPRAVSRPERPLMHDRRCGNIPVQNDQVVKSQVDPDHTGAAGLCELGLNAEDSVPSALLAG
jgi:hypothetical protein